MMTFMSVLRRHARRERDGNLSHEPTFIPVLAKGEFALAGKTLFSAAPQCSIKLLCHRQGSKLNEKPSIYGRVDAVSESPQSPSTR